MKQLSIDELYEKSASLSNQSLYKEAVECLEEILKEPLYHLPEEMQREIYYALVYNTWYAGDVEKSKFYFDYSFSKFRMIEETKKPDTRYLSSYPVYYNIPKISILDIWNNSAIGTHDNWCIPFDIFPLDKMEVISDLNEMTGEFVISANRRNEPHDLMINYIRKINGYPSYLYTKEEYINKYLNPKHLHIAIKNFYKKEDCHLSALSMKHFMPDAKITVFNFYDESKGLDLNQFDEELFNDVINIPTKYILTMLPNLQRNNGLFYAEAYNWIYKYYSLLDGKLLIADENVYFLKDIQLKELMENDFDFAWAEWYEVPLSFHGKRGGIINGSLVGINPVKMKDFFPMPEIREYFETVLTDHFLKKDGIVKYKMRTRYKGEFDGFYTNDKDLMIREMKENNIPTVMYNKNNFPNVNFYIGPITKNLVDTIIDFSSKENIKIGLIASRRQIDYNGGYVNGWKTNTFYRYAKNSNVILCRDHGGIAQGNNYDNGITSLLEDSKYFKILHIDPYLKYRNYESILSETIDVIRAISFNNDECFFEVGTEESIFPYDEEFIDRFLNDLKNELGLLFDRILYCVVQSGTAIKGIKNIGRYNSDKLKNMIEICKKYNVRSKEHNGDYLTKEQIKDRFDLGLDAINIAPEFGVFETDIILEHMTRPQKEKFFEMCLKSGKWIKWVDDKYDPYKNKDEIMRICGHYQFSTEEFKSFNLNLDNIIKERIYEKIKNLVL